MASQIILNITNTSNAAFSDGNRDHELSRIIRESSEQLSDERASVLDFNGNRVGYIEHVNESQINDSIVSVSFSTESFDDFEFEVNRILNIAADRIENGETDFKLRDINGNTIGGVVYKQEPLPDSINMREVLDDVYMADNYSLEEGEYRFIVTGLDFDPGYHQGEGEAWLVNAKGEIAPGYENMKIVSESDFRKMTENEKSDLVDLIEGRKTFEEYESLFDESDDLIVK